MEGASVVHMRRERDKEFRLSASKYLITWPKSSRLLIEHILQHLRDIESIKYACVCEERHADGDIHHHAVVQYFKRLNKKRNVFIIDEFKCNIEVIGNSRKDMENAIAYVKKDGVWIEEGMRPNLEKKIEKKKKLEYAIEHSIQDCIDSGSYSISEICKIPILKTLSKRQRPNSPRKVFWFYGPTGSGKTKYATELMEDKYKDDYWISGGDLKQFKNGYNGERGVILDDLRCGDIKFNDLLRILDRYKYTTNIKGTTIPWLADDIIITSPEHPLQTFVKLNHNTHNWEPREDIEQLIRRIYMIVEFPRDNELTQILL